MRLFLLLIGVVSALAALASSVSAQQEVSGLGVTPLRQEGEIAPGFVYSGTFTIKNHSSSSQHINLSAETFNVINPAYDYLFKENTPEASWVSFDVNNFPLDKDESRAIHYQVSVPLDTEPGGYYLALFATNKLSTSNIAGITPTERVGSLLYLTITGESSRAGKLIQLTSPSVVFTAADWSATLQNTGTLHYRSNYSASVYNLFNQRISLQEDSRLILPHSIRLIESSLDTPQLLGLYKVVYTVGLGDNPSHQQTRWFLYLPPLQTGLLLLIIIGLAVLVRRRTS